ncbi:C2 calcium/lipid-binding plant phosphoribosyltransferase family protein [Perilla frutescens var. frutescens]|nr:C2 calcium/lipid-binding plant phosphoribosyltransferase family protein [Perilla frutescens var. frutescens]
MTPLSDLQCLFVRQFLHLRIQVCIRKWKRPSLVRWLEEKRGQYARFFIFLSLTQMASDISLLLMAPSNQLYMETGVDEMRSHPMAPQAVNMYAPSSHPVDFSLKETSPFLGGRVRLEDRVGANKDEALGRVYIPLTTVQRQKMVGALLILSVWQSMARSGQNKNNYRHLKSKVLFDPATVLTVGVFDNGHIGERGSNGHRDLKIDAIDNGSASHAAPPSCQYSAELPLRRVVEYMNDSDSHIWSMRCSKANFFRLMSVFNGLFTVGKWSSAYWLPLPF